MTGKAGRGKAKICSWDFESRVLPEVEFSVTLGDILDFRLKCLVVIYDRLFLLFSRQNLHNVLIRMVKKENKNKNK